MSGVSTNELIEAIGRLCGMNPGDVVTRQDEADAWAIQNGLKDFAMRCFRVAQREEGNTWEELWGSVLTGGGEP